MKNSKKKGLVFEKKSLTELQQSDVKNIEGGRYPDFFKIPEWLEDLADLVKHTQN